MDWFIRKKECPWKGNNIVSASTLIPWMGPLCMENKTQSLWGGQCQSGLGCEAFYCPPPDSPHAGTLTFFLLSPRHHTLSCPVPAFHFFQEYLPSTPNFSLHQILLTLSKTDQDCVISGIFSTQIFFSCESLSSSVKTLLFLIAWLLAGGSAGCVSLFQLTETLLGQRPHLFLFTAISE